MFNRQMKRYNSYKFTTVIDDYGQQTLTENPEVIKMAINIYAQANEDSILYKNVKYIGLTTNKNINDSYVVDYHGEKLKVLFVNPLGRFNQVFMGVKA